MEEPIIQIKGISKKYVIRHETAPYKTFQEAITNAIKAPINLIKNNGGLPKKETFWALKDITFDVNKGEVIGIIGRNGAGKSTLLKVLSRITEPTEGQITLRGRVASLLEVGTGFHPELTGRENIYLNGSVLGMTKKEINSKFDEIVEFSGVEKFLDTPVKRYSSGMYVRLAFAVAAHLEPEILIVDEVLSVGDIEFQKKCLGKMGEVAEGGRTVLFVSHNMAAISLLCNKCIVLEKGSIMTQGNVSSCIDRYANELINEDELLIDNQQVIDPTIKVIEAKVNGVSVNSLRLGRNDTTIEIEFILLANSPCKVTLETRLKDRQTNCLAVCVPGHIDSENNVYAIKPGYHKMQSKIILPNLNKGTYFLEMTITEPGIMKYVVFPDAIKLYVDGFSTTTGLVFEQSLSGMGFQVLNGSVVVEPVTLDHAIEENQREEKIWAIS